MEVLFYGPTTGESNTFHERFLTAVRQALAPASCVSVVEHLDELSLRLCRPKSESLIVVLLTTSQVELLDILSIQKLFEDTRIILILPDHEQATIARGHRLRPRFVTFLDGDAWEVATVIHKMLSRPSISELVQTGDGLH